MDATLWPDLPYPVWHDTAATLQLWTQIVGKVRLVLTPRLNHSWQVPLYVTARGLGTSPIPLGTSCLSLILSATYEDTLIVACLRGGYPEKAQKILRQRIQRRPSERIRFGSSRQLPLPVDQGHRRSDACRFT